MEKKTALITGAGSGLGSGIARVLACSGYDVAIHTGTNVERARALAESLAAECGVRAEVFSADFSQAGGAQRLFAQFRERFDRLDLFVNNAGIMGEDRMFQMTSAEDMHRIMDVNFFAMVEVSRLATRLMARNKCGAVVNVASIAGLDGDSRLDYSASKAAVIAANKKMARELVSVGIRVNALAPGLTDTDLVRDLSDKVKQAQLDRILLHRMARPEEIANVAAFLASDLASYVTGQVWRVDGGML